MNVYWKGFALRNVHGSAVSTNKDQEMKLAYDSLIMEYLGGRLAFLSGNQHD